MIRTSERPLITMGKRTLTGAAVGAGLNIALIETIGPIKEIPAAIGLAILPVFAGLMGTAYGIGEVRENKYGDVKNSFLHQIGSTAIGEVASALALVTPYVTLQMITHRPVDDTTVAILATIGIFPGGIGGSVYSYGRTRQQRKR